MQVEKPLTYTLGMDANEKIKSVFESAFQSSSIIYIEEVPYKITGFDVTYHEYLEDQFHVEMQLTKVESPELNNGGG